MGEGLVGVVGVVDYGRWGTQNWAPSTNLVAGGGRAVAPGEREGEGGERNVVVDVERPGVLLVHMHLHFFLQ